MISVSDDGDRYIKDYYIFKRKPLLVKFLITLKTHFSEAIAITALLVSILALIF